MGWIKLDREITEHWLWKEKEPFDRRSAWIDLLLMANHKDFKTLYKGKLVERKRGEVNTSTRYLADRWRWSRGRVNRFLELLEADEMVTLNSTTDGTTITIENWGKWQDMPTANSTTDDTTHDTTGSTTGSTNDKKVKNNKKGKEDIYSDLPEPLKEALKDFEAMRKKIGKPLATPRAKKMLLNKLDGLAGDDIDLKIRIIEQSIFHSWQGVFPIKENYENTRIRAEDNGTTDKAFGTFDAFGEIDF